MLLVQENGILQRMEQYKPYYQEPRRKADFNPVGTEYSHNSVCIRQCHLALFIIIQTMDAFYESINDPKRDGAIFFAVCRGKVS